MDLKLSLPELAPDASNCLDTDPDTIKKRLDDLPLLNLVETSHELHKALMNSNRCQVDEKTRTKFLELYREPVKLMTNKLLKTYVGLPLPLSDKHQISAVQVRHFQIEMACGYKWIINDTYIHYKSKLSSRHAARLALPIQRAIHYLTTSLVHAYQQYAPYPSGTWNEIHMLYRFAELHGITELPVEDSMNDVVAHSSISHVYKQALLVDLSDPYHLPSQMIGKIHRYLDLMAPLAQIHQTTNTKISNNCQFLVDLNSDRAGHMIMAESEHGDAQNFRLLNTVNLARAIHGQLTQLEQGQTPNAYGLGDNFFDTMARNMCHRLITSWGVNPKRIFQRITKSNVNINVAMGLEAAVYFLNKARRFTTSAEFMGPNPQRNRIGTLFAHPDPDLIDSDAELLEEDASHELSIWEVIDESAGGMALEKKGFLNRNIRVGEVVTTRTADQHEGWSISVVRWMRRMDDEHIEIGIQRLAPKATPLALKVLNQQNIESEFMPGLLLPEVQSLKQPQSIVSPRGVFRIDEGVYIDDCKMLQKITCIKLLEVTGSYERFQFQLPTYK